MSINLKTKNMFNKKLKNRIQELEKENKRLRSISGNISIVMPDSVKNTNYADLVRRIIDHARNSEYNPYQEKLLSFIVNELTIIRDRFKNNH